MRALLITLLSFSAFLPLSTCWGTLGHRTVAYIANKLLSDVGSSYVATLLLDEDISDAALWADVIKPHRPITKPWHFIDAQDDPPRKCGVNYRRDCVPVEGCIVSAIVEMTARANNASLSFTDNQEALKFLLHFLGDIHQPLHTEAEAQGGNQIKVLFDGRHTKLHSIWDTEILVKHEGGKSEDEQSQASEWADRLIEVGPGSDWLKCTDVGKAEKCSLVWAGEANKQVCRYVLKDDVGGVTGGRDLADDYYEGAVPIVDELVAKAGYRLGAWIDKLAAKRAAMVAAGVVFDGPGGRNGGKEQEALGSEEL